MSAYIDDGEKFVARLGGNYSPGAKKAAKSLELTDRRMYFSAPGTGIKGEGVTSSVIDAADISAVTYSCEKPRGSFGLGIFLLVIASLAGVGLGLYGYFGKEGAELVSLILPIAIGVGGGIVALVLCYVISLLVRRSRRSVTVSVEYRGLILKTDLYGVKDDKLEEFRRWTMRVKDKLVGRQAPPLPESATKIEADSHISKEDISSKNEIDSKQQKKADPKQVKTADKNRTDSIDPTDF